MFSGLGTFPSPQSMLLMRLASDWRFELIITSERTTGRVTDNKARNLILIGLVLKNRYGIIRKTINLHLYVLINQLNGLSL